MRIAKVMSVPIRPFRPSISGNHAGGRWLPRTFPQVEKVIGFPVRKGEDREQGRNPGFNAKGTRNGKEYDLPLVR